MEVGLHRQSNHKNKRPPRDEMNLTVRQRTELVIRSRSPQHTDTELKSGEVGQNEKAEVSLFSE
jgi:hypothetical protein